MQAILSRPARASWPTLSMGLPAERFELPITGLKGRRIRPLCYTGGGVSHRRAESNRVEQGRNLSC